MTDIRELFDKFEGVLAVNMKWSKEYDDYMAVVRFEEEVQAIAAQEELDGAKCEPNTLSVRLM